MTSNKLIALCNIPELSNNYENVINFSSLSNQKNYFSKKIVMSTTGKISVDGERTFLLVDKTLDQLKNVSYLYMIDDYDKYYYYFITNKSYKTSSISLLELEIDVYQTYLFNHYMLDSFVDRCHVNRWRKDGFPASNQLVDEGLEFGEYIITQQDKLYPIQNSYLISATNPLGTLGGNTPPITEDEGTTGLPPGFGIDSDNPFIEWPEYGDLGPDINGGDGEGSGGSNLPGPGENDGNTSKFAQFNGDIDGRSQVYIKMPASRGKRYGVRNFMPSTSGVFVCGATSTEERFTEFKNKLYKGGSFIETQKSQTLYSPGQILEMDLSGPAFTSSKKYEIHEVGNGTPSFSTFNKIDCGNYVIIKGITYKDQYSPEYVYILYGFLESPCELQIGTQLELNTIVGKAGTFEDNNGDTYNGYYVRATGSYTENYFSPYSTSLVWDGYRFGKNMYTGDENILSKFSTTEKEVFGSNVYIPCVKGNIYSRYAGSTKINNLSAITQINTPIVAPDDCEVLFAGTYGTYPPKTPNPLNPIASQIIRPHSTALSNYIVIKFKTGYQMTLWNIKFFNCSAGDTVKKGEVLGTWLKTSNDLYSGEEQLLQVMVNKSDNGEKCLYLESFPTVSSSSKEPQWGQVTEESVINKKEEEYMERCYIEDIMNDKNTHYILNIIEEMKTERQ